MARSIRSTSPVMKNQFSCRPAACVKCGTRSNFSYKIPQISSAGFRFGCFVRSALFHADCSRRSSCFRVLSFRRVCRSPLSVLVHLWFAVLFEEVCPITTLGWRVCGSVLLFEEVCPITTLGWRVCGSVLFFHSRLACLWPICVRTAQSVVLHRCQMPRGHAPARFRSESSVRAVVVDESPTVCASDMSLGEATCEESGLECTFQSCMVQC